jgi:hypothetical protein
VPFVLVPRELDSWCSWCSWCSCAHVHIQSTTTSVPAKEGQLRTIYYLVYRYCGAFAAMDLILWALS